MDNDDAELDRLQGAYKSAVDTWVAAIRAEEALSSGEPPVDDTKGSCSVIGAV